jgi:hypothetical protein
MADFVLGRLKFTYKSNWATSTAYIKDDIVSYGGNAFAALLNHTSGTFETDLTANKWNKLTSGQEWKGTFANSTAYKADDLVKYGSSVYICTTAHTTSSTVLDESKWSLYVGGVEFEDSWSNSTAYQTGDIVTYGGYSYIAVAGATGQVPYNNASKWKVLTTGFKLEGTWASGTVYETGDVVNYGGNAYVFKVTTTAGQLPTNTSYADLLVEGVSLQGAYVAGTAYLIGQTVIYLNSTYRAKRDNTNVLPDALGSDWALYTQGDPAGVLSNEGSLVTRDGTQPRELPIGRAGERLIVGADGLTLKYGSPSHGQQHYVSPHGLDTNPGTEELPFASIKKACQTATFNGISQIASIAGGTGGTPGTFRNVAVTGGSSSGTIVDVITDGSSAPIVTIIKNGQGWAEGNTATIAKANVGASTANITFTVETVTGGDTIRVSGGTFEETFPIRVPPNVTIFGDSLRGTKVEPAAGNSTEVLTLGTIGAADSSRTAATYTNIVATTASGTGQGLKVTVVVNGSGACTVTPTYGGCYFAVGDDLTIADSLLGSGGGATLTFKVASVKANNVSIMWLVNNANYLSFMTFQGMTTGGTVAALDPTGSITTASPYLHNNTSVNTGCTGMLIDGNAQVGGNKSMISNDFTQINTDGIGVSVLNGARAELVSVFTYYCNKGLNAESGGVIRALNCSNAYGEYGAYATGVAVETPDEVQLRGSQWIYQAAQGTGPAGYTAGEGDTMVGATSGVTAVLINQVAGTRKMQVETLSNVHGFIPGETVTITDLTDSSTKTFKVTVTDSDMIDGTTKAITAVTQANPAVVTSNGHGMPNGTKIKITSVVGMTQLNNNTYYVANTATNTFSLSSTSTSVSNVNSSGYGAYSSAGTITPRQATTGQTGYLFNVDSTSSLLSSATAVNVGSNFQFTGDSTYYRVTAVSETDTTNKQALIAITPERTASAPDNTEVDITKNFSNVRLTGHDFLSIGTGSFTDTNYPNAVGNTQPYDQSRETTELLGGRVYYTSTDQLGNFRVGSQFKINQATGSATLNADSFDLSGLTQLQLGSIGAQLGATINEFSTDGTLGGNSDTAVPTEQAVKTYVASYVSAQIAALPASLTMGKAIAAAIVFG